MIRGQTNQEEKYDNEDIGLSSIEGKWEGRTDTDEMRLKMEEISAPLLRLPKFQTETKRETESLSRSAAQIHDSNDNRRHREKRSKDGLHLDSADGINWTATNALMSFFFSFFASQTNKQRFDLWDENSSIDGKKIRANARKKSFDAIQSFSFLIGIVFG